MLQSAAARWSPEFTNQRTNDVYRAETLVDSRYVQLHRGGAQMKRKKMKMKMKAEEEEQEEKERKMKKRDDRTRPEGHRHRRNASWPVFALIFFSSYTHSRPFSFSFSLRHASARPSVPLSLILRELLARADAQNAARVAQSMCSRVGRLFAPRSGGNATKFRCSVTARKAYSGRDCPDAIEIVLLAQPLIWKFHGH